MAAAPAAGTDRGAISQGAPGRVTARSLGAAAWRGLRSRRLAIALLALLAFAAGLGAALPQIDRVGPLAYGEWTQDNPLLARLAALLGLDALYSSWWFLGLFALLYVNTLACTLPQLRRAFALATRPPVLAAPGRRHAAHEISTGQQAEDALASAARLLQARGYRVAPLPGSLDARKGTVAVWGSPIFHLGLVVVLTGAAIAGLFRFSGYVELGEGQGFANRAGAYTQATAGPLFNRFVAIGPLRLGEGYRDFAIQLDRFSVTPSNWGGGIASQLASEVRVVEGGQEVGRTVIRVNEPLEYGGMWIYPTPLHGPAPIFEVVLPDGSAESGMVNLADAGDGRYENTVALPGTTLQMTVRATEGSQDLKVEVTERKYPRFAGQLAPGGSATVRDVTLTYREMRQWTALRVENDPGTAPMYAGFALTIAGLALGYLFERREVWIESTNCSGGTSLRLGGNAPRLRALFAAELEELATTLRGTLEPPRSAAGEVEGEARQVDPSAATPAAR